MNLYKHILKGIDIGELLLLSTFSFISRPSSYVSSIIFLLGSVGISLYFEERCISLKEYIKRQQLVEYTEEEIGNMYENALAKLESCRNQITELSNLISYLEKIKNDFTCLKEIPFNEQEEILKCFNEEYVEEYKRSLTKDGVHEYLEYPLYRVEKKWSLKKGK